MELPIWWEWSESCSVMSDSLPPHGLCSPWNSAGHYTKVGIQRSSLLLPGFSLYICLCVLSCVWLCDLLDCTPPGSSLHGILQARILEWVAIPFSRGSSWPRDPTQVSHISGRFFTIWAIREAPPQLHLFKFGSVQLLSHVWLLQPHDCSMPCFSVHHQLSEFARTHVHWVGDAIQPSHPLLSPFPLAFSLS